MLALAAAGACARGPAPEPGAVKKVLVIGIDGVRWDALMKAETPNIDALMAEGAWSSEAHTGRVTVSGPGWSSILCGVWMDRHGVTDNSFNGRRYEAYPNFLSRAKRVRPDLTTAAFVDWLPLDEYTLAVPPVPDIRVTAGSAEDGDSQLVAAATRALSGNDPAGRDPDVTFFYFGDADGHGHKYGYHPSVPEYVEELSSIDAQIGELLSAIRGRATYDDEDWLILVSTDHGGTIDGVHGPNAPVYRTIFFIASGPSAARGPIRYTVNQVDVAATALVHLGIDLDPAWNLDGRPAGLPRQTRYGENLIFNGDAEYGSAADSVQVNRGIAGWTDLGDMTVLAYGASEGYPSPTDPGPDDRGSNFFVGGRDRIATITQRIDLADIAAQIDRDAVRFRLSAYLGGFADQRDLATLTVRWFDERGGLLQTDRAGPVTRADRIGGIGGENPTGLLYRERLGDVPVRARAIEVELTAEAAAGLNDGYADNLSLVLEKK